MAKKENGNIQREKMQLLFHLVIKKALKGTLPHSPYQNRSMKKDTIYLDKVINYMLSEQKEYIKDEGENFDWTPIKYKLNWILPIIKNSEGNINYIDEKGQTILHTVLAKYLHESSLIDQLFDITEVVQTLANKASVNHTNNNGDSPLHIAAHIGNKKLITIILEELTNVNISNKAGDTPLHIIVNSLGDNQAFIRIISTLLSKGADPNSKNKEGMAAVHFAAEHCLVEILQILKKHGADFNLRTDDGKSLLHLVCNDTWGWKDNPNDVNTINFLVSEGCLVDATDNEGYSPVHYAAVSCTLRVIRRLIHFGADVNLRTNKTQLTPLHVASRSGNAKAIEFFINAGTDVNVKAIDGITPLHLAVLENRYEAVECLVRHGADVQARENMFGYTSMHMMAIGCEEKFKVLVNNGAEMNVFSKNGITPLHLASIMGNVEVIQALIKYGAGVHSSREYRWTPLHLAALSGKFEAVKVLIDCGADVNCHDKITQMTPLNLALMKGKISDLSRFEDIIEYRGGVLVVPYCSFVKVEMNEVINTKYDEVVKSLLDNGAEVKTEKAICKKSFDNIWWPMQIIKRIFFSIKNVYLKKLIDRLKDMQCRDLESES